MKKGVIIAVICLLGGLGTFKIYQYQHPERFPDTSSTVQAQPVSTTPTASPETQPTAQPTGTMNAGIMVNRPAIDGVLKGVVEVGASGFNSFVVKMDKQKNWELIDKRFGASNMYEGFGNEEDVRKGLMDYISGMFNKGVKPQNIHFVISSGALKGPKTEMIAKGIEARGYVVNRVTAQQEGVYGLKALLSKDYANSSFVVDIGSGNTKISWMEGMNIKSVECSGAKYYMNNKTDEDVFSEITSHVMAVPQGLRQRCFIIGGVPHQLAEISRIGNERFTQLASPDQYSLDQSDVKGHSGLNIYKALQQGTGCSNFIFDWDANFTIGFLLGL